MMLNKEVKKRIIQAYKDGQTRVEFKLSCPNQLMCVLENLGAEVLMDEFETNGWQYDWWLPIMYEGTRYIASGSGFYGNAEIYKEEEDV